MGAPCPPGNPILEPQDREVEQTFLSISPVSLAVTDGQIVGSVWTDRDLAIIRSVILGLPISIPLKNSLDEFFLPF